MVALLGDKPRSRRGSFPPCAMERQEYCAHRLIRHTPGVSVQMRYIRVQCSRRGREGTARLASVEQPRFPDEFGWVLGENPLMLRARHVKRRHGCSRPQNEQKF